MHMKNVVFRQYDIRGIVGEELIIEEVYELARAVAYYVTEKNPKFKNSGRVRFSNSTIVINNISNVQKRPAEKMTVTFKTNFLDKKK